MEKQSIEDDIKKMELEVEFEERKAIEKQELFVQDLDDQVQKKADETAKDKAMTLKDVMVWEQRTRDKNELADKLTKMAAGIEDLAIAVSTFKLQYFLSTTRTIRGRQIFNTMMLPPSFEF